MAKMKIPQSLFKTQFSVENALHRHACYRYHDALLFPLSDIFPKIFFLKELDDQWIRLFHDLFDESHIKKWNENLHQNKLEVLLKSSLHYLDHHEKEAVFVYYLRSFFKDLKHNHLGLKEIVKQCKDLLQLADIWEKQEEKVSAIRSLGQSYLLFILTLNNSVYSPGHQKKVLALSYTYGKKAQLEVNQITDASYHPYFGLLFCLLHIASGDWDKGTKELHALANRYPDPKLYEVLSKLYIKIGLPNVSEYFKRKLAQSSAFSGTENSDFNPLMKVA